MISAELEDEIVRLRKELPLDNGAEAIWFELRRVGEPGCSVATVHRALVRRGLVVPQPQKRPKASFCRFEWPEPNDAWQIDATAWVLAGGGDVCVMDSLDDHSRLATSAVACAGPTGDAAWAAFLAGCEEWGVPARVMSDNGSCFTGRFHHDGEVAFERDLRAAGVEHWLSSPGHPQTCGKLERFHQTEKKWLSRQPRAETIEELQAQLDAFRAYYNFERPHRALGGETPAERWAARPPATPGPPIPGPTEAAQRHADQRGVISFDGARIPLGKSHAGRPVVVVARDGHVTIFGSDGLIAALPIDPTRRYQSITQRRPIGPCH